MTAPKEREEIQRYRYLATEGTIKKVPDGQLVIYGDHLRNLKLAQIEVLEEMLTHFCGRDAFIHGEENWIFRKIAALRKELGS